MSAPPPPRPLLPAVRLHLLPDACCLLPHACCPPAPWLLALCLLACLSATHALLPAVCSVCCLFLLVHAACCAPVLRPAPACKTIDACCLTPAALLPLGLSALLPAACFPCFTCFPNRPAGAIWRGSGCAGLCAGRGGQAGTPPAPPAAVPGRDSDGRGEGRARGAGQGGFLCSRGFRVLLLWGQGSGFCCATRSCAWAQYRRAWTAVGARGWSRWVEFFLQGLIAGVVGLSVF
jgi:hypothetical protein